MFRIYGDATVFHQWAMDYALTNEHMVVGDRVSFRTATGNQHVMYAYDDGGTVMVNVPNRLLQQDKRIIVNLSGHPGCQTIFDIIPGDKPDGYDELFTEADKHDPKDVESRVKALEANGGGSGGESGKKVVMRWEGADGDEPIPTCDLSYTEFTEALQRGCDVVCEWYDSDILKMKSSAQIIDAEYGNGAEPGWLIVADARGFLTMTAHYKADGALTNYYG